MTAEQREELIVSTLPLIKHIAHKVMMRLPATIEMHDLIKPVFWGCSMRSTSSSRNVVSNSRPMPRFASGERYSIVCATWIGLRIASQEKQRSGKGLRRTGSEARQARNREEASAALGGNLEDFHALVDQLHGLTVGSFETAGELDEKGEGKINYYPNDGTNDPMQNMKPMK